MNSETLAKMAMRPIPRSVMIIVAIGLCVIMLNFVSYKKEPSLFSENINSDSNSANLDLSRKESRSDMNMANLRQFESKSSMSSSYSDSRRDETKAAAKEDTNLGKLYLEKDNVKVDERTADSSPEMDKENDKTPKEKPNTDQGKNTSQPTLEIPKEKIEQLANSGKLWKGNPFREFPKDKIQFRNKSIKRQQVSPKSTDCEVWGVLTTVFSPSEAVRQFLYKHNWCLIIVGDKKCGKNYKLFTTYSKNIVFLSYAEQMKIDSEFIKALPTYNYGRKNIAFIYAVTHGAKYIWDFDDDNILKFWLSEASQDKTQLVETYMNDPADLMTLVQVKAGKPDSIFFNPYPYLGGPTDKCWPRGFPISEIRPTSVEKYHMENVSITRSKLGILQSLADHEPDVDAIYRMVEKTPFYFNPQQAKVKEPLMLSQGLYSPMNAQATLHYQPSFFALYLPVSVHGRVTDIWRSYIAQTLFSFYDVNVAFLPKPLVDQDRNPHTYQADFQAEIPLYVQAKTLVTFLNKWRKEKHNSNEHKTRSLEDLAEELYIELYQRGYIEEIDVKIWQMWLQLSSPYFPSPVLDGADISPMEIDWTVSEEQTSDSECRPLEKNSQLSLSQNVGDICSQYNSEFTRTLETNFGFLLKKTISQERSLSDKSVASKLSFCLVNDTSCIQTDLQNKESTLVILFDLPCEMNSESNLSTFISAREKFKTIQNKEVVYAVSNRYSYHFVEFFTGPSTLRLLPSNLDLLTVDCEYDSKKPILIIGVPFELDDFQSVRMNVSDAYKLRLEQLTQYSAVVIFPSGPVSSLSLILNMLEIPVFVPSVKLWNRYQKGNLEKQLPNELNKHKNMYFTYNPKSSVQQDRMFWLQFSDVYEHSNVIRFKSKQDLENKLKKTDLKDVHLNIKKYRNIRRNLSYRELCDFSSEIIQSK